MSVGWCMMQNCKIKLIVDFYTGQKMRRKRVQIVAKRAKSMPIKIHTYT